MPEQTNPSIKPSTGEQLEQTRTCIGQADAPPLEHTELVSGAGNCDMLPNFGPPTTPGDVGTLGPYRIVKRLGAGGMGAVYLAVDTRLNRTLALKVMLPEFAANPAAKSRFLREARAAAQITHDNVVTVYEADDATVCRTSPCSFCKGIRWMNI